MSEEPTFVLPFEEEPPLTGAPAWGQELARRQSKDRHTIRGEMTAMMAEFRREIRAVNSKLGEEPNSDGAGGKGLIGDFRKMSRDLDGLMALRNKGLGFVAAVALFGAIIVAGLVHFVQQVIKP